MYKFQEETGTCGAHVLHELLASLPFSHTAPYIIVLTIKTILSSLLCACAWCIDMTPMKLEIKLGSRSFATKVSDPQASPFSYEGV